MDRPATTRRLALSLLLGLALLLAACGSDGGERASDTTTVSPSGKVINVPADAPTIQAAVDSAASGDLVLIAPGVYNEGVNVTTDGLTIRGVDRNGTILDGQFKLENGVRVLGAKNVTVQNMTARNYTSNGFYWTGVEGYHGSYLTAYRTGNYGIYAFDSVRGQFDNSYASGSPDAGFYIGQCYPCDAVIKNVVSEYNGLGYSGTNSGGNLTIVGSTFRFNRAGIVPNSGSYELCYPERETTIVGNVIHDNNQPDTPAIDVAKLAMSNGILVAGGRRNTITKNLVYDHERTGIGLVPFPEDGPNDVPPPNEALSTPCSQTRQATPATTAALPATVLWDAEGNTVTDNVVMRSGLADLAFGTLKAGEGMLGNCFSGNTASTSAPADIQLVAPCTGTASGDPSKGALDLAALIATERPPSGDYKTQPIPPAQPNMPDATSAPAMPAVDVPEKIDVASVPVPSMP